MNFITDMEHPHIGELKCSVCGYYLSVKPILTNIQNGKSVCGRCETPSRLLNHNHWFEHLANQFMFPCKYTDDGCIVRIPFAEISIHENTCSYSILKCYCSWSGYQCELKAHYENMHMELLIKEGDVIVIKEGFSRFLITSRSLYFLINCTCRSDNVSLEIIGLTTSISESKAIFTCKLFDLDFKFKTELNMLTVLPFAQRPLRFILTSEIDEKVVENILKTLVCPNCLIQMVPPILRCSRGHVTCLGCTKAADFCPICDDNVGFECLYELECLAVVSTFTCRWNCGSKFNVNEVQEHEQSCEKRLYDCFHWECIWRGPLQELTLHKEICFPEDNCKLFINPTEISFLGGESSYEEYHVVLHNCMFTVSFNHTSEYTSVHIASKDVYSMGRFCYIANVVHTEDPNFPFNKTYEVESRNGCGYNLDFAKNDILKFGKDSLFKVIVHIDLLNDEERRLKTDTIFRNYKNYIRFLR